MNDEELITRAKELIETLERMVWHAPHPVFKKVVFRYKKSLEKISILENELKILQSESLDRITKLACLEALVMELREEFRSGNA